MNIKKTANYWSWSV